MLLGGIAFVVFAIAVLATFMPVWLSALIVTVLLLGGGALAMKAGLERIKKVHKPHRTIQTLKEDSQWASRTVQSMKSQMQGHA
jgi:Putative Actinobacterial Holin-X, holin superfamily III